MNILFISLLKIDSIEEHGLYNDLLREFANNSHKITVVSPVERRTGRKTEYRSEGQVSFLNVRIGNIQKTNYIEKGISTLMLGSQLQRAIGKYCKNEKFDLILYATPPITICGLVSKIKKKTKAKTFLMLKDIWPQEMVDLGIITTKSPLYAYFRGMEKKLYRVSDFIGCTSPANISYLVEHNPEVDRSKIVQVNNSVDISYPIEQSADRNVMCEKYGLDPDAKIFFYGGNLGQPQGIDHIIDCLKKQVGKKDRFFAICGGGTGYKLLERFFGEYSPNNMKLIPYLPKKEYDSLVAVSDVGLVFLNHRFTVPNCPSRLYTYMEYGKPAFACTDSATDIKDDIQKGEFGWWCESSSVEAFEDIVDSICECDSETLKEYGKRGRKYLEENFAVTKDYETIIECIKK